MIVFVVGLFQKVEDGHTRNHIVSHICYDAESVDDAKRDLLITDSCLETLSDGYALVYLHTHLPVIDHLITRCKEIAKETLRALHEVVEEHKEKQEAES